MKKIFILFAAAILTVSAGAATNTDNKKYTLQNDRPVLKAQLERDTQSNRPAKTLTGVKPETSQAPKAKLTDKTWQLAPKAAPERKDRTSSNVQPLTTYNYKCGPTAVTVTDQSGTNYYQFEIDITQDAKNTTEYTKTTVYPSTVKLIIYPETNSIAGTFSADDYSLDVMESYVLYNGNYRYVSAYGSTFTIEAKGGNKYAITGGTLIVENSSGSNTYYYNYCYDNANLNDAEAPVTPFEFTFGESGEPGPGTNAEVVDAHGIITAPAKGDTIVYNRRATNTAFYYNNGTKLSYQSGTATMVECEDGTVYWLDPVSYYTAGSWIKGKKEGSTITFPTKQPVTYNSNYGTTLSVRWGYFSGSKFSAKDSYADSFIFDIDGTTLTMRGTSLTMGTNPTYFPGIFWDDDDSFQGYGDCGVELFIPEWTPSTELITPPAGLSTAKMPFTATGSYENYEDSVLVGWNNKDVYIQGLCLDFPSAWIKGTLDNGTVTFEKFQYLGKYSSYDVWALGTNADSELIDFTMAYDAQKNIFAANNILVENASYETIFYLDKLSNIIIGKPKADWGEWEDFAPFGFNTGSWTYVATAQSPITLTGYEAQVRADKNDANNKQIKIANWGEGFFSAAVEMVINWNAGDNSCSIGKQFTGYTHSTYGQVFIESVEAGSYDPQTGIFSNKVKYTCSAGTFGTAVETFAMDTKKPGLQNDEQEDAFNAEFAWSEMEYNIGEGEAYISATNADKQTISLTLFTGDATTIPAGTYVISDTQEAGTALQSAGISGGYVTDCFAGLRGSAGLTNVWFMVSGQVTITYDEYGKMNVAVEAKNSYDVDINATVTYVRLEPSETVNINASDLAVVEDYLASFGVFEFTASDGNYTIDLYAYANGDTPAGEYKDSAIDLADCTITTADGNEIGALEAEFSVYANGEDLNLIGWVMGTDTVKYVLNLANYEEVLNYNITSDNTVEIARYNDGAKYAGEIEIPETVMIAGKVYNVTAIADQAFAQCTEITKITIGANVATIGKAAFSFCTGLTSAIICNAENPTVGKSAFYKVNPEFIPTFGE